MDPETPVEEAHMDEGQELIVCGACAHPNLPFRNHCRRCGARLTGSANLVPGADLFEWTSTDGAARTHKSTSSRALGGFVIALLAVPFIAAVASWSAPLAMALVAAAVLPLAWGIGRGIAGTAPPQRNAVPQAPETFTCSACGGEVAAHDDICPHCGEVLYESADAEDV